MDERRKPTIDRMIDYGFGKHLDFFDLDEETFRSSVTFMMDNYESFKPRLNDFSIVSRKLMATEDPLELIIKTVNRTIELNKFDFKKIEMESCSCFIVTVAALAILAMHFALSLTIKTVKFLFRRKPEKIKTKKNTKKSE